MNKRLTFYIWGYYGTHNSGDDAMLIAIIDYLRRNYPNAEIGVTCEDSAWIEYNFGNIVSRVSTCSGPLTIRREWNFIVQFLHSDIIIIGGGTFLQDYGKYWKNLFIRFCRMFVLKLFGKKMLIIGAGAANIQSKFGKILTHLIILLTNEKCCIRDKSSIALLREIGINKSKMQLTADLTFLQKDWFVESNKKKNEVYNIGISVLPYYEEILGRFDMGAKFVDWLAENLNRISEIYSVRFHFISMKGGIVKNDYNYAERISSSMHDSNLISRYPYQPKVEQTIKLITQMDFCIGMRLHFLIFSYLSNIPIIGISYNNKVKGFMKSIYEEGNCLQCDNSLFSVDIVPLFDRMIHSEIFYKNRECTLELMQKQATDNFDGLIKVLKQCGFQ